jgi:DnaJ-class molecular chaperone
VFEMLCGKTVHRFEIEKARSIFMLSENYTMDELKKARKMMLKVYHPDTAGEGVTRESQIINKAYDLLKLELN